MQKNKFIQSGNLRPESNQKLKVDKIAIRDIVLSMHIITRKRIVDFANDHPNCASGLESWFRILKHSTISNFIELQAIFPSTDKVEGLTVFNIGGNKVRLIAAIHYNTQRVYIRYVLTHSEYDKNKWKEA